MDSIVTEYKDICFFCGRPAECEHHLVFGQGIRELAEEDGLKVPACDNCHNMAEIKCRVHDNPMAEKLSKRLGQAILEREYLLKELTKTEDEKKEKSNEVRERFRKRYGRSYL